MYPEYFGSHFEDFTQLGKLKSVDQLSDTVVVETDDHYLLYVGNPLGSLVGMGWKLTAIKDKELRDLELEHFIKREEEDVQC